MRNQIQNPTLNVEVVVFINIKLFLFLHLDHRTLYSIWYGKETVPLHLEQIMVVI